MSTSGKAIINIYVYPSMQIESEFVDLQLLFVRVKTF